MVTDDRTRLMELALVRLFRICSRPFQDGDHEEYDRCRAIILDGAEPGYDHRPNYARDRDKGAQGD